MLFAATAGFVLWQNTRVAVLWDLSYLLDTAWRITLGQVPYRDFPFVHAPLTFLIQAGLIRLAGRHYFWTIAYAVLAGGLASVLTWRILLRLMRGSSVSGGGSWWMALVLSAPLPVLGIYSVYPHPIYDCDCTLALLIALLLVVRLEFPQSHTAKEHDIEGCGRTRRSGQVLKGHGFSRAASAPTPTWASAPEGSSSFASGAYLTAGAAAVLPLFFKQNIGLAFLAAVAAGMLVLIGEVWRRTRSFATVIQSHAALVLVGGVIALLAGLGIIAATAGLGNYIHWTIQFAAERRLPGLASMLSIYQQWSLAWTAPTLAAGLILCYTRFIPRWWARIAAFCLIAAPFAGSLMFLLINDDMEDRADSLLALWPLLLLAALIMALFHLRRGITLGRLTPFFVLAAIHGAFLSQQLWGSTYAMWPLLLLLVAGLLAAMPTEARTVMLAGAAVISITFLVCGGLYAISLDRLLYTHIPDAPLQRSSIPALRGMATPGPFLPNLDELVRFASTEIPQGDALLLLPGDDPFYYATGRTPQFPVTLFDPATDPYSATGLIDEARRHDVRWAIVKRVLQIDGNPMPEPDRTMQLVQRDFVLYRQLPGYDVYRRR